MTSGNAGLGGLVGSTAGTKASINQGWFAGTVTNTATGSESTDCRGTGGIVGLLYGTVTLENCLNEGTIDASTSTKYVPKAGGLVGAVESGGNLTFTDCLNTGDVLVASGKLGGYFVGCYDGSMTCNTSYGYGNDRVVGYRNSSQTFKINYILNGSVGSSNRDNGNYYTNQVTNVSETTIKGNAASTRLEGFDFDNTWKVVENSTPILNFDVSE